MLTTHTFVILLITLLVILLMFAGMIWFMLMQTHLINTINKRLINLIVKQNARVDDYVDLGIDSLQGKEEVLDTIIKGNDTPGDKYDPFKESEKVDKELS